MPRYSSAYYLKSMGLIHQINPQVESLGNLQKVTVALRESDSDRAGLRAVEIVSAASTLQKAASQPNS